MSERELRVEAVRRRLAGESPTEIAAVLGRTTRWVRKWVARHDEDGHDGQWAQSRSRAPLTSPTGHRPGSKPRSWRHGPGWSRTLSPVRIVGDPMGSAPCRCRADPTSTHHRTSPRTWRRRSASPAATRAVSAQERAVSGSDRPRAGHHPSDRHDRPEASVRCRQVPHHEPDRCWLAPGRQRHRHRDPPRRAGGGPVRDLGPCRRARGRPVRQPRQLPRRDPTGMAVLLPDRGRVSRSRHHRPVHPDP